MKTRLLGALLAASLACPVLAAEPAQRADDTSQARGQAKATLQPLAQLDSVPVGIAISRDGRTFLAFSRSIDEDEPLSVAELKGGKPVPFPQGLAQDKGSPAPTRLLAVQALTVDARNRLWMLDSGKVGQNPVQPGSAKLVAVDLATNRVVQTIPFPAEIAGASSFLNDVRIDLGRGAAGVAFLTDASPDGPSGLVVVDLKTGKSVRRLDNHPSTRPEPGFVAQVEGKPLLQRLGPKAGQPFVAGSDGLALDADGKHLYYSALAGHHLYRVSAEALADAAKPEAEVANTVEDLGDKGYASDGLLGDAQGRLYLTDYEGNAVHRRTPDGKDELVIQDPKLLWPDSMALDPKGGLVFTATQIERGKLMRGADERIKPFTLWRVQTDSRPLLLGAKRQARTPR